MKHLLTLLTSLCLTLTAFSQSYQIESIGSTYTQAEIDLAFSSIDWCERSYKNKSRELLLDDGAKVIILPSNGSCGQEDTFLFTESSYAIRGEYLVAGQSASNPTKVRRQQLIQR